MITKSTFPSKNCEDRAPKGWTLEELKEFAKSLNLPVSGKKADLCARIREFLANNSSDLSKKEEKEIVKEIKKIEKKQKKEEKKIAKEEKKEEQENKAINGEMKNISLQEEKKEIPDEV